MLMNYRYPALVKGQIGTSRSTRPLMVAMRGRAKVEELEFNDAPVAATVYMPSGKADYRHYQGKLYRAATDGGSDEFRSGLDTHMAFKIADACHLPAGKDIQPWPKGATDCLRNVVLARDNFRCVRGEYTKIGEHEWDAMLSLSDLGGYEREDLERWEAVAARYVGDLISLDGDLWIPVVEPVLAVMERRSLHLSFVDNSVYDGRHDNPKDKPAPFGRREGLTSPFWLPEAKFYSLLEVDGLLDSDLGPTLGVGHLPWLRKPEIYLPSVFDGNHLEKELDRVARVVVAEVHSFYKEHFGSIKGTPAPLRNRWHEMRQTLSVDDTEAGRGDQLAHHLQLTKCVLTGMKSQSPLLLGSDTLMSLIRDMVDRWANREISLDVSWSRPKAPGL